MLRVCVWQPKSLAAQWVFVNIDWTSKHSTKAPKCQLISGSRAWGDARFKDSRELFERMCTCLLNAIYQIGDTRFTRLELSKWSDSHLKWWIDVTYAGKTEHVAPEWSQIGMVHRKCSENLRKHGQIPPWGFILFSQHHKNLKALHIPWSHHSHLMGNSCFTWWMFSMFPGASLGLRSNSRGEDGGETCGRGNQDWKRNLLQTKIVVEFCLPKWASKVMEEDVITVLRCFK